MLMLVLTLIANPKSRDISTDLANEIASEVGINTVDWLGDGCACDIVLDEAASNIETVVGEMIAEAPIDLAIQKMEIRKKEVLIADMDSTMIDQECIDELAAEVGIKERVAAITAKAMNGEIEFEAAVEERVALLKGLDADVTDRIIENRITLASGGKTLVQTMKAGGAYSALVSGGFTTFTSRIAAMLGFDENRANVLEEEEGKLAGTVRKPILGAEAKVTALNEIASARGLRPENFIAVGDGANDLPMLQLAGTGVALHAKPSVAAQSKISIKHGDLTSLLYLQGYRENEFTDG
ncbi:MAG: phosphoserine phosphatase SerB [Pseudomonadota bacterium]